jgi:hypothetical protein
MTRIWLTRPITLEATMSVPGIQSPLASTAASTGTQPALALDLDIRPHHGVGPLRLEMSRLECRAASGGTHSEFSKTVDAERTTDELFGAVHVYYDDQDRVEYIEIARSADVRATFDGTPLLELAPAEAVAKVAAHAPFDEDDPELGCSYVFKALDLSLWRPVDDEDEPEGRTFMAVGIGRRGYYS